MWLSPGLYNQFMTSSGIERLLQTANSSEDGDTSVTSGKRHFLNTSDAEQFFRDVCDRLLKIDEWNKNSSVTEYELFGAGREDGKIQFGSFIRIKLYGSGKSDWVRVLSIAKEPNEMIITVKPSHDPTEDPVDESLTSHFFGPEATNSFCVQLDGQEVAVYVIGLNERQNTRFTDSLIESARNAAVANVGYYTGLQKSVWKQFCKNFLEADEENDG
jgi:hypothetical protein